jgi:tetratricopeptide (TPR) repeat protein
MRWCAWSVARAMVPACRTAALASPLPLSSPLPPPLPRPTLDSFAPAIRAQILAAQNAAEQHPLGAGVVGRYGMVLHAYHLFDAADAAYARAQLLVPGFFAWTYYRALELGEAGKPKPALEQLRRAVALNSDYVPALVRLVEALALTDLPAAQSIAAQAVQRAPDNPQTHYSLGQILAANGNASAAAEQFEAAVAIAPDFGKAHYALAAAYRMLNQPSRAQTELALFAANRDTAPPLLDPYRRELDALQQTARPHLQRAQALFAAGYLVAAESELLTALDIEPSNGAVHLALAGVYGQLSRWDAAQAHYQAALATGADPVAAHFSYSLVLAAQQRYPAARELLQRTLAIEPHNPSALTELGVVCEALIDDRCAETAYRQALDADGTFRMARARLGQLLLRTGRPDDAIAQFHVALTPRDAEWPRYAKALGDAYVALDQGRLAEPYYRDAYKQAMSLGQKDLAGMIVLNAAKIGVDPAAP